MTSGIYLLQVNGTGLMVTLLSDDPCLSKGCIYLRSLAMVSYLMFFNCFNYGSLMNFNDFKDQ